MIVSRGLIVLLLVITILKFCILILQLLICLSTLIRTDERIRLTVIPPMIPEVDQIEFPNLYLSFIYRHLLIFSILSFLISIFFSILLTFILLLFILSKRISDSPLFWLHCFHYDLFAFDYLVLLFRMARLPQLYTLQNLLLLLLLHFLYLIFGA